VQVQFIKIGCHQNSYILFERFDDSGPLPKDDACRSGSPCGATEGGDKNARPATVGQSFEAIKTIPNCIRSITGSTAEYTTKFQKKKIFIDQKSAAPTFDL
jgi:hypothetical protein